jgi:hypothetical protein
MIWNPDAHQPLKSGSISILNVEECATRLLREFLGGWFDGGQHIIAGMAVKFPQASLTFQECPLPNPLEGLGIQVSMTRQGRHVRRLWSEDNWMITERCTIDFYVRARVKTARPDGHNSHSLVRWGSDSLFNLFSSIDAVKPLLRRGIGVVRPLRSVLISASDVAMRHVMLAVNFNYPSETVPGVIAGAPESYTRFKDGAWQLLNDTTGLWHAVHVEGSPAVLSLSETGEAWDASQADNPVAYGYRWKDGDLQLRNADTGLWFSASVLSDPPQTAIDAEGQATNATSIPLATQKWRWKKLTGIQFLNPDTGRYHTVTASGVPPSFSIDTTGEP